MRQTDPVNELMTRTRPMPPPPLLEEEWGALGRLVQSQALLEAADRFAAIALADHEQPAQAGDHA